MGMGAMTVWMFIWSLVGLAVLVLAGLGVVWLIGQYGPGRSNPAEAELRRRYAAGEIDDEEYQRRRASLHVR